MTFIDNYILFSQLIDTGSASRRKLATAKKTRESADVCHIQLLSCIPLLFNVDSFY